MKGIFPSMPIPDIVEALSAWGVVVSPEQLSRPSPDFVEGVFSACLYQVTDINQDALREPGLQALNQASPVDKEQHIAPHCKHLLLFHLTRLARACRVDDFSSKDVWAPEQGRTALILSAFINFIKFTEQFCAPFVKKLRGASDAVVVGRERVARDLEQVDGAIRAVRARMAEDEPKCRELREENASTCAKLFAVKDMQQKYVQQVEALKTEKTGLIQRKENLNAEVQAMMGSLATARNRIVQSPERMKRTITQMTSTAKADKETIALHESKARDLQAKIAALSNIEKDVHSCIEQLKTIEKEVRSLEASQKELHALRDMTERKDVDHKELRSHRERLNKQLSNAQDKLERAQRHAEERRAASQREIERLKQEYAEMANERRDTDREVEEIRGQANEVERRMAEHMKTSESELNQLLSEYWKLRRNTDVYMETLANELKMTVAAV
ncbi:hypothetical protein MKEN_01071600 [Mycena kentingensis (nom. inval.)]|nr:hypothetical protein MKEN_01071600 [Mycena kentingensis (nom. inval.)]